MHDVDRPEPGQMGRFTFFMIVTVCSFVYYTLPGFVFTAVSTTTRSIRPSCSGSPPPLFGAATALGNHCRCFWHLLCRLLWPSKAKALPCHGAPQAHPQIPISAEEDSSSLLYSLAPRGLLYRFAPVAAADSMCFHAISCRPPPHERPPHVRPPQRHCHPMPGVLPWCASSRLHCRPVLPSPGPPCVWPAAHVLCLGVLHLAQLHRR